MRLLNKTCCSHCVQNRVSHFPCQLPHSLQGSRRKTSLKKKRKPSEGVAPGEGFSFMFASANALNDMELPDTVIE